MDISSFKEKYGFKTYNTCYNCKFNDFTTPYQLKCNHPDLNGGMFECNKIDGCNAFSLSHTRTLIDEMGFKFVQHEGPNGFVDIHGSKIKESNFN